MRLSRGKLITANRQEGRDREKEKEGKGDILKSLKRMLENKGRKKEDEKRQETV